MSPKLFYSRQTLNSFHNTLLFGAKFLIIRATHFNHCKTFFLAAKLSSSRQNFLTKAKLPFSWQTFKSKANFFSGGKTFLPLQNFSCNLCTTSGGGAPLREGVRLFYRSDFFQVFAHSRLHFFNLFVSSRCHFKFQSSVGHNLSFVYSGPLKGSFMSAQEN